MSEVEIPMSDGDFERFKKALRRRLRNWQGKPDIHGNFNSSTGHAVGLWGEIALLNWLGTNSLPARWTGEDDDALADIEVCRGIGIETKAQQPRNWTCELATTVQKQSYDNWLQKPSVLYVVWTVCQDPQLKGVHPVLIKGWNTVKEVGDSGLQYIRGTQQYRTYPKYGDPHELVQRLKHDCA